MATMPGQQIPGAVSRTVHTVAWTHACPCMRRHVTADPTPPVPSWPLSGTVPLASGFLSLWHQCPLLLLLPSVLVHSVSILMLWTSYVMNLLCHEPLVSWISYVMKLLCHESIAMNLLCYESFMLRISHAMNLLCYESRMLRISYVMKLLCYETLMLWNSYVMKLKFYETLILWNSYPVR